MARTSKKKQANTNMAINRKPAKMYSVGIYARLSVDTNDRKNESIETQVETQVVNWKYWSCIKD